jgi:hypothetical protein
MLITPEIGGAAFSWAKTVDGIASTASNPRGAASFKSLYLKRPQTLVLL